MTEAEAVALAREAAQANGYVLSEFEAPSMRKTEDGWWAFFDGKHPAPVGKHFSVEIDDATRTTRLIHGR